MTMQNKIDAGFTMIEILIAIAVVGILAVIAIPQYQNYVIRSKVSECLNFAGPAKNAIAEAQASQRNILFSFSPTPYCANVQLAPDGTIVLTTQNTGADESPVLQMTPWGAGGGKQLRWDCQFVAGEAQHVPTSCRTPGIAVPADKLVDSAGGGGSGDPSPDSGSPGSGAGSDDAPVDSADGGPADGGGGGDPGDAGAGADDGGGGGGDPSSGAGDDGAAPDDTGDSAAPPAGSGGSDVVDGGSTETGGGGAVVGDGAETPGPSDGGSGSGGGGAGAGGDAGGGDSTGGSGVGGAVPPVEDPKEEDPNDEKPVGECPHKLPNGKPHPSKCTDWGK